jgi:uncharacterized protein YecT (DUF1311 family)
MRSLAMIAAASALLVAVPASAQSSAGRSSTLCPETAEDARGRACQIADVQEGERRLGDAWTRTFAQFGGSRTPSGRSLLAAQRAWIAFKDRACALYFLPGMSSMEWSNGQRCKGHIIEDRIAELDRLIIDFPGED